MVCRDVTTGKFSCDLYNGGQNLVAIGLRYISKNLGATVVVPVPLRILPWSEIIWYILETMKMGLLSALPTPHPAILWSMYYAVCMNVISWVFSVKKIIFISEILHLLSVRTFEYIYCVWRDNVQVAIKYAATRFFNLKPFKLFQGRL